MKTKFLRIGKSSLSVVLSVLMIVSTVVVGSSVTVDKNTVIDDVSSVVEDVNSAGDDTIELTETAKSDDKSAVSEDDIAVKSDNAVQTSNAKKSAENKLPEVSGATTKTVYFYNTTNWSTVKAYYYGGGSANQWPGEDMTHVSGNLYSIKVPVTEKTIIFNNGSSGGSNQTANLSISGDNYAYAPNNLQSNLKNNANINCSSALYEITLDSSKTYLLYWYNSYGWTPCYAYMWNSNTNNGWPGELMSNVSGYSNLYALDISSGYSSYTNLIFSDGTGTGDKVSDNRFDYSSHKSMDLGFNYSTQTYQSSSTVQTVWIALNTTYITQADTNGNEGVVRQFQNKSLSDVTGIDTREPKLKENEIKIYAKSGTVRDQGSGDKAQYNKYSELADTTIKVAGTTVSEDDGYGFSYYKKSGWWSYSYDNVGLSGNRVTLAHAAKGTDITITTKIDKKYKDKYYVKAFCINGHSFNTITEEQANANNRSSGIYTYTYTIPKDVEALEITPIYFYFENGHPENYIIFNVEDFTDEVRAKWGNTIACYVWYQKGDNGATVENETTQQALGGYPGQPMVEDGGSYYIQVPKYDTTLGKVKGMTLNNYVWDDVHGYYLREYEDFNGLDRIPDASFNEVSEHRKKANAQTYDYDDFVALSELKDVDEIIFSFKYRTFNNDNAVYSAEAAGKGNLPKTSNIKANEVETRLGKDSKGNVPANGWNTLVDYDDVVVDLFGNQLTQYTDTDILTLDNDQKLFIVSDGYINYYSYSQDANDQVHDKYLGEYATKWYVYTYDGSTYTYQGALPPSAFITTAELAKYDRINENNETEAKKEFAKYLLNDANYQDKIHANAVSKLFATYKKLFNAYKGMPAVITYESALNSNGRYGADPSNWGYRNDGRWYYSRKDGQIHADTKILIYDPTDTTHTNKVTYGGKEYIEDNYKTEKVTNDDGTESTVTYNYGGITGATACFNDTTNGREFNGETYVETERDKTDNFVFSATKSNTVGTGDNAVTYVFKGWYLETGGNVLNTITESNTIGSRKMNSIATFVAVYEKVTTRSLIVNHNLYSSANIDSTVDALPNNGTGSTYVKSIEITDANGKTIAKYTANEANTLQTSTTDEDVINALKVNTNKVKITLSSVPSDSDTTFNKIYEYDNTKNGTTESKYVDKNTTLTYERTVEQLFGSDATTSKVVTLDFFSDFIKSVSNTVKIKFKYYDRAEQNNAPATINTKEHELNFTATFDAKTSLEDQIAKVLTTEKHMNAVDNVIDEYLYWTSLNQAANTSTGFPNQTYYREDNKKYSEVAEGNEDIDLTYHTDSYSRPKGYTGYSSDDGEQWVTYYDVKGKKVEGVTATNETTKVSYTNISSVTVWAYNTPKQYTITVYSAKQSSEEDEEFEDGQVVTKLADGLYSFTNNNKYSGFYNQRLNVVDDKIENPVSNDTVDYLQTYFGVEDSNADGIANLAYTGDKANAPATAVDSSNKTYKFDGWYTPIVGGGYAKVSSDREYGNRITGNLTIYAVYKEDTTMSKPAGVSVTINGIDGSKNTTGVDYYFEDNGTEKVRLNTQINVYYEGGTFIDSDPNIEQVSVIYVNGINSLTTDNINKIKSWLESKPNFLSRTFSEDNKNVRLSGPVDVNGDGENEIVIIDTYNVSSSHLFENAEPIDSTYVTLTNKNRIQFVLPMTEELYSDTYNKLIAFAAIKYYDKGDSDTDPSSSWIVSDNCVSYIKANSN